MNIKPLLFILFTPIFSATAVPPPPAAVEEFHKKYPCSTDLQVMAEAQQQGSQYYIIWGETLPEDGSEPDSSGTDEATIKIKEDGTTETINKNSFTIPPENYLRNAALCKTLMDSYVEHRTEYLGGKEAMQNFLNVKTFMSHSEAYAFKRAGFTLNPATQIFQTNNERPYTTVGKLFPTTSE